MARRHEFIGRLFFQTAKAILFQDHFWTAAEWMPKSQIRNESDPETPDEIKITAAQWICTQKNIREFEHIDNEVSEEDEIDEEAVHKAMLTLRVRSDGE